MPNSYPATQRADVSETFFGETIADPYRWLEDEQSPETRAWIKAQNQLTQKYLQNLPLREPLKNRYQELFNFEKRSLPWIVGDSYIYGHNTGLLNQPIYYRQKKSGGQPAVLIDPNEIDPAGTTSVQLLCASTDDRYLVYALSKAGSDWMEVYVWDLVENRRLADKLEWIKFTTIGWRGDGFYYTRYPAPEPGRELSAASHYSSIYYHRLGDDSEDDKLIFMNEDEPRRYHSAVTTEDERFLLMYIRTGTDGFELRIMDLEASRPNWKVVQKGFSHKTWAVAHRDGWLYLQTDLEAERGRIVRIATDDLLGPWETVVPQSDATLQATISAGDSLFLTYLEHAVSRVYRCRFSDLEPEEIPLPGLGSAFVDRGKSDAKELFYSFTSYTHPMTIFRFDLEAHASSPYFSPKIDFDFDEYRTDSHFFTGKDGTRIHAFLTYRRDMKPSGDIPTYLYGYGGFNISLTPGFSAANLIFLEQGGLLVTANLRGGGEYGESWHQAGMRLQKQNVFDDAIAVAEGLIEEGWTAPRHLAIAGGSNGGLLVGAVINQRPDLFAAALPAVGVMDMLRFHRFTVGWGWVPEYGAPTESEKMFRYLLGYSPLHNLRPQPYPAVLVTTADHDDRVVPAHSYKYVATLQAVNTSEKPAIIRIETSAGHGMGKPTHKIVEEVADQWAFVLHHCRG